MTLACDSKSDPNASGNSDAALGAEITTGAEVAASAVPPTSAVTTGASTLDDNTSGSIDTTSQTLTEGTFDSSESASASTLTLDTGTDASTTHDAGDGGTPKVVNCDPRDVVCRRVEPACEYGFVPRIVDRCFGDCVAIDTCTCDGPEACPQSESYTCNNSRQRCTPYLN